MFGYSGVVTDDISSMADFVSRYVDDMEVQVTGDAIAEGVEMLLHDQQLMQGRAFKVAAKWNDLLMGYDVWVTMTQRNVTLRCAALLPEQDLMSESVDVETWSAYMRRFVVYDLMPAVRKKLTHPMGAISTGFVNTNVEGFTQSINGIAIGIREMDASAKKTIEALRELEELKAEKDALKAELLKREKALWNQQQEDSA